MDRFDFVKIRHVNHFFAVAAAFCVLDAAAQLHDPYFLLLGIAGGVASYFVSRRIQQGDRVLPFGAAILVSVLPIALLVFTTLVLLAGPEAVEKFRGLFMAQAVLVGFRLKVSD